MNSVIHKAIDKFGYCAMILCEIKVIKDRTPLVLALKWSACILIQTNMTTEVRRIHQ